MKPVRKKNCCVSVLEGGRERESERETGRLVATGGGKQVDLSSFDHPRGRRWLGVSARRLEGGGKWREKLSLFQQM